MTRPPGPAYQLTLHHPGPRWRRGVTLFAQEGVTDHIAYMRTLLDAGALLIGGPFLDDAGGGACITQFADLGQARTAMLNDPAVITGLLSAHTRPWFPGMTTLPTEHNEDDRNRSG